MSDTIHRMVTERMMAALDRGTVPWRKPWQAAAGRPRSMSTGQPYRGVNVFLLGLTAAEEGYASPYWGTYRQISDLGGQVRRGERSTLAIFWKQAEHAEPDPQTGEPATQQLPVLRYYRVFNAAQAGHLPGRFYPAPGQHAEIAEPQEVLDRYLAGGPRLAARSRRPGGLPPRQRHHPAAAAHPSSGPRRTTTPRRSTRPGTRPATRTG